MARSIGAGSVQIPDIKGIRALAARLFTEPGTLPAARFKAPAAKSGKATTQWHRRLRPGADAEADAKADQEADRHKPTTEPTPTPTEAPTEPPTEHADRAAERRLRRGHARRRWYRAGMELGVEWLGRIDYRDAWARQHALVAARRRARSPDTLLLLEHPAGPDARAARPTGASSAPRPAELAARGIELIRVERGGEVTYHGPGQLVAYPIVRLADRGILLRPFVRALEAAMAETCATLRRRRRPARRVIRAAGSIPDGPAPRKMGALGLRVERGVSYHGIALNVTTDLADFELIDPCGMPGRGRHLDRPRGRLDGPDRRPRPASREAADRFAGAFGRAARTRPWRSPGRRAAMPALAGS